ncbi:mannosyltransferase A [Thiosulfatimonas sediminis]|uniref:Mannosyltransferase A n=1 Tax=Thiosulfatimonas sediminis TaxID=2675054 RepID=A0A6F8PSU3_9GAMM|nr:glycosyltransferase [Thiosulfatimonas sediminis]BBP45088.1 mannosyltransferase A [Thiosulfatimonas sediminis]
MSKILIDMQGAQAPGSRFRGIGRYSLSLVKAMLSHSEHEFHLLLNGQFTESLKPLDKLFSAYVSPQQIHRWFPPQSCAYYDAEQRDYREPAQKIREAVIASIKPDVVFITSLFEGFADDCVIKHHQFVAQDIPVACVFYDLIPYLYPKDYLDNSADFKQFYYSQLDALKQMDAWGAISYSSKRELQDNFPQVEQAKVLNLSAGLDEGFAKRLTQEQDVCQAEKVLNRFGIHAPFVLYTGGADSRKNLDYLITAYARLAETIKQTHQLVFAGKLHPAEKKRLESIAIHHKLDKTQLIFTGYLSDDDLLTLYRQATLFVFPSRHEGFGLPPLEAMAAGTAVLASNQSSLPEVVGLEAALFDPYNLHPLVEKMTQVLAEPEFRKQLENHGIEQAKKFTWAKSAKVAIDVCDTAIESRKIQKLQSEPLNETKPTLAIFSPLPPEISGIADYQVRLLKALNVHYQITLIHNHSEASVHGIPVRSPQWFEVNAGQFERIVYQIGASLHHLQNYEFLKKFPGVVVLHDFYFGNVFSHQELQAQQHGFWRKALWHSHGFPALLSTLKPNADFLSLSKNWPVNLSILQSALGLLVHSDAIKKLAQQYYGAGIVTNWQRIPFVSSAPLIATHLDTEHSTSFSVELNGSAILNQINPQDTLLCSFGLVAPSKATHSIIEAFAQWDALYPLEHGKLVIVGSLIDAAYQAELEAFIVANALQNRVYLTDTVDAEIYHAFLQRCDLAIQLKNDNRGETSASVVDCLSAKIPLIINAIGWQDELPKDICWSVSDTPSIAELVAKIAQIRSDIQSPSCKAVYQQNISDWLNVHTPDVCARAYYQAIESCYPSLEQVAIKAIESLPRENHDALISFGNALDASLPRAYQPRRLLLDVTATIENGLNSGIERYARQLFKALLSQSDAWRVELVYLHKIESLWQYVYANKSALSWLDVDLSDASFFADGDVSYQPQVGDVVLGLDWAPNQVFQAYEQGFFNHLKCQGVQVGFTLFDMLPLQFPDYFPEEVLPIYKNWLRVIMQQDFVLTISESICVQLQSYLKKTQSQLPMSKVYPLKLGADFIPQAPLEKSRIQAWQAAHGLVCFDQVPTFIMVGTIEPRKGHRQVLDVFTRLWQKGVQVQLVVIGKKGWCQPSPASHDSTVVEKTKSAKALGELKGSQPIIDQIEQHPKYQQQLFWLQDVSDQELVIAYQTAQALIFASEGEGFGLPLVEAMFNQQAIIARELDVFREVAGEYPDYFRTSSQLYELLKAYIADWPKERVKHGGQIVDESPWLWKNTAQQLLNLIIQETMPDESLMPQSVV